MSETTILKLFKHDNPSTNTDQFDVEKALNENWDKIEEFAKKVNEEAIKNKTDIETNQEDISNLKKQDISQNELIEQLQKRNALLESQIPTGQASGENITIKDSSNMPFKKFEISGNDYQKTSKASSNILDPNKLTSGFINMDTGALEGVNSTYPNSTYTPPIKLNTNDVLRIFNSPSAGQRLRIYNLDGTYNSYVNESYYTAETDCLVRVLFLDTINDNTSIKINNANSTYEEFTPDMPSLDYPSEVRACGDNIQLFDKDNANIVSLNANATKGNSGTYATATNQKHIYIECEPNTNYAIKKSNDISSILGIYETSEIPKIGVSYYCHYFSSSNSDEVSIKTSETAKYLDIRINTNTLNEEQLSSILGSIKICKGISTGGYSKKGQGSITFKKSNKNLAEIENGNLKDGTGAEVTETNCIRTKFIPFSSGNNLTVQYKTSLTVRYYIYYLYDKDKNFISSNSYSSGKTITTNNENVAFIRFKLYGPSGGSMTIDDVEFQVEEGSIATTIIEHKGKTYIVPTQQPFYKGDTFVKEKDVVTNLGQNSGVNLINENLQAGIYYAHFRILQKPTASTTFSCYINETDTSALGMLNINNYDVGKEYVKKIEITEDSTIKYVLLGNSKNESIKFQFAINKSKTGFENNLVQIQGLDVNWNLAEGVHRYEKHNKYRKIFDGTENFNFVVDATTQRAIYSDPTIAIIPRNYGITTKCSHFNGVELKSTIASTDVGVCQFDTASELMFLLKNQYPNIVDKASWVDWVTSQFNAGKPLYVDYVLAEPIYIECTAEQNAELDEIEQDENYKNITHIYSEDEISSTFNVEYYKDRETTEKNLEDRITALEELLSTTATSAMLLDNMQTDLESEV